MKAEILQMYSRPVPTRAKEDALAAAKHSMRLLVRAANQDRCLIENKDWQQCMTHLNEIVQKQQQETK
jgi:hypothetical protein